MQYQQLVRYHNRKAPWQHFTRGWFLDDAQGVATEVQRTKVGVSRQVCAEGFQLVDADPLAGGQTGVGALGSWTPQKCENNGCLGRESEMRPTYKHAIEEFPCKSPGRASQGECRGEAVGGAQ